jgi:transposase InsO family protein
MGQSDRERALALMGEAVQAGCRKVKACEALGLSVRTVQRWERTGLVDGRKSTRAGPANRLSDEERARVLAVLSAPENVDKSPHQLVPMLADRGEYIGSESTLYRILREEKMLRHRQASRPARHYEPTAHAASAANQVWSWDITWLKSPGRGLFFYLYLIVDLYSRKIVAWQVHEREDAEHAAELATEACYVEGVAAEKVVLHSDNGAPMKGATMLSTLQRLGVIASFSRPSVSDDNAFSEALFRTLKYCPAYPRCFADIDEARAWVERFVRWYNGEHRHSGLKFVTPEQRHTGRDAEILRRRHAVYQQARAHHPQRWTGQTRNWSPARTVYLTSYRPKTTESTTGELREAA